VASVEIRVAGWLAGTRSYLSGLFRREVLFPTGVLRSTASLVLSAVTGTVFFAVLAVAFAVSAMLQWVVGLRVLALASSLRLAAQMAWFDRWRAEHLAGIRIEPATVPAQGQPLRERIRAWAHAPAAWRLAGYQAVRLPVIAALMFGAVAWWWATIVCFVLAAGPRGPVTLVGWHIGPVSPGTLGVAGFLLLGAAGIVGWPAAARSAAAADARLARSLLGPGSSDRFFAEVRRLSRARTLAVESAEAERRRIERDLHDGLQPRLVSLALDLGLARKRLAGDPEAGELIDRAHTDAKTAIDDLRALVRGIHPSVLDERGLDAALSALAAGCAVPVEIRVEVTVRLPQATEATAYYVVAEAITNVTKHSGASAATVRISDAGGQLRIVITDDGRGGAAIEPGGGFAGLAARVAAIDGTLRIDSPAGGPTRVEAQIPCRPGA
jgi:signal transduction histidine kinase